MSPAATQNPTDRIHRSAKIREGAPAWRPIIAGSSAEGGAAWQAISAVAEAVLKREYPTTEKRSELADYEDALLFAYYAQGADDADWMGFAEERLNSAIAKAGSVRSRFGLHGGVAGLGWAVEHISRMCGSAEDSAEDSDGGADLNIDTDRVLLRSLQTTRIHGCYDLISGFVGYGIYFLERFPEPAAVTGIRLILDHIDKAAERCEQGVRWHTRPELLPPWQLELAPNGYYNLGVAHGVPGIIYFLNEVAALGIERERCLDLLDGAIRWMITNECDTTTQWRFSAWIGGQDRAHSRLSWCYGDLGILAVMLQVIDRDSQSEWNPFTERLLDHCLRWPATGPEADPAMCHGAVGVAHIFNRVYQTRGDERCRDAAIRWFHATVASRVPGEGVGGFSTLAMDPANPTVIERRPNPDFLDGAGGVALALISAVTDIEPRWDRAFLLSGFSAQRPSGSGPEKS